jgi:hypothetical protein
MSEVKVIVRTADQTRKAEVAMGRTNCANTDAIG